MLFSILMCNFMRLNAKQSGVKVGKMCNVGQHASMISTPLPPLIRFSSSTWHLVLRSFWHCQTVL